LTFSGLHNVLSQKIELFRLRSDSRYGQENFFFSTMINPALKPTHPPSQGVKRAVSPVAKWKGGMKMTTHLNLSADVKNGGAILSLLHKPSWRDV
jgi:hypothetical protein